MKNAKGGHGRKKKLKALTRYRQYEKHFVETYNHMVSSRVVKFALNKQKPVHKYRKSYRI